MKFSLTLLLAILVAGGAKAGPYADLEKRLSGASPTAARQAIRQSSIEQRDPSLAALLNDSNKTQAQRATAAKAYVSMRALFEGHHPKTTATPIAEIKKSALYRKAADEGGDNWLARALQRIRFNASPPTLGNAPNLSGADSLGFLVYVMWAILAVLVAAFLFFAVRYFVWKVDRQRNLKPTAMLEDDEPQRSVDEWLELAAQLESEGRFREAVRCLYVACLLRFDEHRVARFDRTQTNWEHFRRIQASPTNPREIDLLGPTTDFDHIWYGFRPTSATEVQRFRAAYQKITAVLSGRTAGAR